MTEVSKDAEILHKANLRLCRLRVWSNYNGIGFDLESSSKAPFIIELVATCSPAAAGGLQKLDVVLAVNNQDLSEADYKHVGAAIKNAIDTTGLVELLVVEQHRYQSLKKKKIKINVKFAYVIDAPRTMPNEYETFFKYPPRTCTIHSNGTEGIFGFDIACGENNIGAYIDEILPNTPAGRSSLNKNDRIIEINDIFVDKDASNSIFKKLDKAKIKGNVKLFVIDMENYKYYQRHNIPLSSKESQTYQYYIDNGQCE
jgi:C-terminal processing protease CtpA/Prc